ncbi:MAG: hypothetical protein ACRC1J_12275 [Sandaracinobacteroides sp.]
MIGRLPLWAMLVPLIVGIGIWAVVWSGFERRFAADLASVLPAGTVLETGGFPYRLEATAGPLVVAHDDRALQLRARAGELQVNRVPWQRDRQVLNLRDVEAQLGLKPIRGAVVRVAAPSAQASLRLESDRISRLSIVWETPTIQTGLFATPAVAKQFEAHLRETPGAAGPAAPGNPRLPTQVQLVLSGSDVRFGGGAPLALALDSELTARAAIDSLDSWANGGTAEIRSAILSDSTGEVARMKATLVPDGAGSLRLSGTVLTVCPMSVRAAVGGTAPVAELRTRRPELVAISGTLPGGLVASVRDPAKPAAPVRRQEPPCPRLR